MSRRVLDLTGQTIGRLTALSIAGRKHRGLVWLCRCECGNTCAVLGSVLSRGRTKSCGCLRRETYSVNMRGKRPLGTDAANRSFSGAIKTHAMRSREEAIADTFRDPLRLLDAWRKRIAA